VVRENVPPATEVLPARFRATVYELDAAGKSNSLDPEALAREAATPAALLSALSNIAKTRIVFRIDQPVNVFSEQIAVGASEPVVTATRTDPAGRAVNLIRYSNVGLILQISAERPPQAGNSGQPVVKLAARISALSDGNAGGAPALKAASVRAAAVDQTGPLEFGHPRVMVGASSTPGGDELPIVYVARYVFDTSRSPGNAAGAKPIPVTSDTGTNRPAQFQAAAYEVKVPQGRILQLDADTLAAAAGTPEQLLSALAALGEAKLAYRIDQVVNVLSDEVTVSTNEQIAVGARMSSGPDGQRQLLTRMNRRVGLQVRLSAPPPSKDSRHPNVSFTLQASGLGESKTEVTAGVKAPATYVRSTTHSEPLEFGQPRVIVYVAAQDPQASASCCVFRYVFNPPPAR